MNIKTLHVQNFKNFEDKTLEFSKQFNLFIGDNGTGKSTLIDALAVAASTFLEGLDGVKARTIKPFEVRLTSFVSGQSYTQERQFPSMITASGEVLGQSLEWTRTREATHGRTTRKAAKRLQNLAKSAQEDVRAGKAITLPVVAQYTTARLWLERREQRDTDQQRSLFDVIESNPADRSRLAGYTDALEIATNRQRLLRWFAQQELASLQSKKPIAVFEAARKAMISCVEGCSALWFDVSRQDIIVTIHDRTLPWGMLSDGQRNMLTMVADIAHRMAVLNPHLLENATLETPGVVLIDELDLHLHPRWQRHVVEDLRKTFPSVQFFATSHSPFIVQSLRPGELIDLNETPGAAEYQDKSIEDIVELVMDVPLPQMSERKQDMLETAKKYYEVLEQARGVEGPELEGLKARLDELSTPFSEDPAYQAFLEMERVAALGKKAK